MPETMARTAKSGRRGLQLLIATDGSASAQSALATALACPWPAGTSARALIAVPSTWLRARPAAVRDELQRGAARDAARMRRALARRWPEAEVLTVDGPPAEAIVREARAGGADVVAVGWRGHGAFRRMLMGSVSRAVVRRAPCSVLVARRRSREIRRIVIGVDGSPHARRAVELAAAFEPDRGGQIVLVHVVDPMPLPPTAGRLPGSIRAMLRHEVEAENAKRKREGRRELDRAAALLGGSGWRVRTELRSGAPLAELIDVVRRSRSHLLIVGARAVEGVERALIGSVAEGALDRSPVPVLVVR
jgi:nucleotide-binding universal stress UspA family protein